MTKRKVVIVDLFAGGGGASNGAKSAIKLRNVVVKQFVAVNHWADAIATHEANHPDATHYHCAVEEVDPRKAITGRIVHLLIAGPSCTTHSNAKGGQSRDEQSRTSPWSILNWVKDLYVRALIIENVPEFEKWGPLNSRGKPIRKFEGQSFRAFIAAIEAQGYNVQWRVLNAADYGDATSRRRLFILARRHGCGEVLWPEPTHIKPMACTNQLTLFQPVKPIWRTAREIINFDIPMGPETSIFNRAAFGRLPLSENTMRRIYAGLFKHGLKNFILGQQSGAVARGVDEPLPTVAAAGAIRLVSPYIVKMRAHNDSSNIDEPVPTITAGGNHLFLAQPIEHFLVEYHGGDGNERRTHSINEPLPTQDTSNRFGLIRPEPYILSSAHGGRDDRVRSIDATLPTIAGHGELAMAQPYIVSAEHGSGGGRGNEGRARSIDMPLPTISATSRLAVAQPYIVKYYGTGEGQSIDTPLGTVTSKERFALCVPLLAGYLLVDILFRMLHWSELAAAMSFPSSYIWLNAQRKPASNKNITKMIGNAWPNETGGRLCFMQLV